MSDLDDLLELAVDVAVCAEAVSLQSRLAAVGGHRSAGPTDLLIAATAIIHDAVLIHNDRDFDYLVTIGSGLRAIRLSP